MVSNGNLAQKTVVANIPDILRQSWCDSMAAVKPKRDQFGEDPNDHSPAAYESRLNVQNKRLRAVLEGIARTALQALDIRYEDIKKKRR
jgi:hypothetical protein